MSGSIRPPFPSAPSDPALRRLGVGPPGGDTRPIRAQLIVVIVLGLMLLAVPLYLWRRPSLAAKAALADAGASPSASTAPSGAPILLPNLPDAGALDNSRVKVSAVRKVRCGSTARQASESETCESLAYFEKALTDAVKGSVDCAQKSAKAGSINFVLEIDFAHKKLHVFPGASGDWRGPKARRVTKCVMNALPSPEWDSVPHQHRYYAIAVMGTFAGTPAEK
ncbi:MAG TPA: hypothetical protein VIV60_05715 [Polyangiaceae bacterium]